MPSCAGLLLLVVWSVLSVISECSASPEPLIILDFDDTLYPSSLTLTSSLTFAQFETLISTLESVFLTVSSLGEPVIVTAATRRWFDHIMTSQLFPLAPLFDRVPFLSTRDTPAGSVLPSANKSHLFKKVISEHAEKGKTVFISVSDSDLDRFKFYQVCLAVSDVLCHSIKFVEQPSFSQLIEQLEHLKTIVYELRSDNNQPHEHGDFIMFRDHHVDKSQHKKAAASVAYSRSLPPQVATISP